MGKVCLEEYTSEGAHPFLVVDRAHQKKVYYIDREKKLSCHGVDKDGWLVHGTDHDYIKIETWGKKTLLTGLGGKRQLLIENELGIGENVARQTAVLSADFFFCGNAIYSLADCSRVLDLGWEEYRDVLIILEPEEHIRVLILAEPGWCCRFWYYVTVDIEKLCVLSTDRKAVVASSQIIRKVSENLYMEADRGTGTTFYFYDSNGKLQYKPCIYEPIDMWEIDGNEKKLYVFLENRECLEIDCQGKQEPARRTLPSIYRRNWVVEAIVSGKAYFVLGKKTLKCMDLRTGNEERMKFSKPIDRVFLQDGCLFVKTLEEPDFAVPGHKLVEEGECEIFRIV